MKSFDGILLVQLGSPATDSPAAVKEYLLSFLGDPHTLGNPPFFWNGLLRYGIAPLRSRASARKYQAMRHRAQMEEMPLVFHSRAFAAGVAEILRDRLPVALAFQHGCRPSIREGLEMLMAAGARCVRVVPLYPQRSGATTQAVIDQAQALAGEYPQLSLTFVDGFAQEKFWVQSVADSIRSCISADCTDLLFSWHGMQENRVRQGDPYEADCEASSRCIGELLGMRPLISYQSKFGFAKWLGPSTEEVLRHLARKRARVLVVCPAFTVDNLETLYEMDVEARELFLKAGGLHFERVPCLNADPQWIRRFAEAMVAETAGENDEVSA